MASVPNIGASGQQWAGLGTTGRIPDEYLKRGVDNLGQLIYIERHNRMFAQALHSKFPKSKTVETREHKVHEMTEPDRLFTVTSASVSGDNHTTFGISNAQAAWLQANDMLYNKNIFVSIDGTPLYWGQVNAANAVPGAPVPPRSQTSSGSQPTAVNYSRIFGQDAGVSTRYYISYEPMKVITVGAPDSAGAGSTTVTVRRCYTSAEDRGGSLIPISIVNTNINAQGGIVIGDQLIYGMPAWMEGTGPAKGFFKNPEIDVNFTQEFKYSVEVTTESTIEKTWMGKSQREIYSMLREKRAARNWEHTLLFGKKAKEEDDQGRLTYAMGGIIEFILKDTDHIIPYAGPTINWPGLLDLTTKVFNLGGGSERWALTGLTLYNELRKAFYSSGYMRYDPEASKEFNIDVDSIVGSGGKLIIMPLWTLEECGWGNKMILLDMTYPSFVPVTHKDWDMKIESDIQEKGTQIVKDQWIGMKGLERRYRQYHSIATFNI